MAVFNSVVTMAVMAEGGGEGDIIRPCELNGTQEGGDIHNVSGWPSPVYYFT